MQRTHNFTLDQSAYVAALEAALIDARDTLCDYPPEDDDRYYAWFNRHEAVFSHLATATTAA